MRYYYLILMLAITADAQTTLHLRNLSHPNGYLSYDSVSCGFTYHERFRSMTTTQPPSGQGVAREWQPTSATPPCRSLAGTQNGFGFPSWISPPLLSPVTITGITAQASCVEYDANLNAGIQMRVYRWSKRVGGIVSVIAPSLASDECSLTTITNKTLSGSVIPTDMEAGDRIVVFLDIINTGGSWGGNGSRKMNTYFNYQASDPSGRGPSIIIVTPTLNLGSDTYDRRAIVQ